MTTSPLRTGSGTGPGNSAAAESANLSTTTKPPRSNRHRRLVACCADAFNDTLPPLRAVADALPPQVTDLEWDLTGTPFTDVAGLHLLFTPPTTSPRHRTTVTGLREQPLCLVLTAADADPAAFDLTRLLPDLPQPHSGLRPPERPSEQGH